MKSKDLLMKSLDIVVYFEYCHKLKNIHKSVFFGIDKLIKVE